MNKKVLIGIGLGITVAVLCLSFSQNEESEIVSVMLNDTLEVSLLPISASQYCKRHGEDKSDVEVYEDFLFYTMKLNSLNSSKNPLYFELENKDEYGARVKYFSEQITSDLHLIQGEDTLSCILSHWERTYNIRPDLNINLVFEKKSNTNPTQMIWNSNPYSMLPTTINLN